MTVLNNHIDLVSNDDLDALLAQRDGLRLSLFMPTVRMGTEVQQNPIRFKNLVTEAENRLNDTGLSNAEQQHLLEPLQQLYTDRLFWQQQNAGLAVYSAPGAFYSFRLPLELDELVIVSHRFHIKPLLPLFSRNERFFILALSINSVQLFQATAYTLGEIPLEGIATSLDEALRLDDPERETQFHTSTDAPASADRRDAVFHGHAPDEDRKNDILRFFHKVDDGISAILAGEQAPLVLAGVEYLHPLYRAANTYAHVVEGGIYGNPTEWSATELHNQAWAIVQTHLDAARQDAANRYRSLAGQARQASDDVEAVLPAAAYGRVDTLFVARDTQVWGQFDPQASTVQRHDAATPANDDLLDMAAAQTLRNGGAVYVVAPETMPGSEPVAAIFRY